MLQRWNKVTCVFRYIVFNLMWWYANNNKKGIDICQLGKSHRQIAKETPGSQRTVQSCVHLRALEGLCTCHPPQIVSLPPTRKRASHWTDIRNSGFWALRLKGQRTGYSIEKLKSSIEISLSWVNEKISPNTIDHFWAFLTCQRMPEIFLLYREEGPCGREEGPCGILLWAGIQAMWKGLRCSYHLL